jgi:hypothetical protein
VEREHEAPLKVISLSLSAKSVCAVYVVQHCQEEHWEASQQFLTVHT